MKSHRALVLFGLLSAAFNIDPANAEPKTVDPKAASIVTKPISPDAPAGQVPAGQQGQQVPAGQQGPQVSPNQIPPPQTSPAQIPVPDNAIDRAVRQGARTDAAARYEIRPEDVQITRPSPNRESLGLDQLQGDDARRQGAFDPARFGRKEGSADTDALVEQLRAITGKSNRDRQSDTTRGLGSAINADPGSLLNSAGAGLAGDNVEVKVKQDGDGNTITTTTRRDESGNIIQHDVLVQDSNGNVVHAEDRTVGSNGDTIVHRAERTSEGDYVHSVITTRRDGNVNIGPTPWRSPEWTANVDPDSAYGKGSGQVVGPGQKAKDPKMVEARAGIGPGARPDDGASASVTPRLNVNVDLVGQPNPTEGAGGAGPGYHGYNPNDFVRPPRPNDP